MPNEIEEVALARNHFAGRTERRSLDTNHIRPASSCRTYFTSQSSRPHEFAPRRSSPSSRARELFTQRPATTNDLRPRPYPAHLSPSPSDAKSDNTAAKKSKRLIRQWLHRNTVDPETEAPSSATRDTADLHDPSGNDFQELPLEEKPKELPFDDRTQNIIASQKRTVPWRRIERPPLLQVPECFEDEHSLKLKEIVESRSSAAARSL